MGPKINQLRPQKSWAYCKKPRDIVIRDRNEEERERRQSYVPAVVLRGAIGSKHRVGDGVNPTVFPPPTTIYKLKLY